MNQAEVRKKQIQYYSYAISAIIFLIIGKGIGNNGLAYLAVSMEALSLFIIFVGDIIADTYAKMIRNRRKRKLHFDVIAIRKRVFLIQIISGILMFLLVLLFADKIAFKLFQMKNAALLIRILAIVILFRMLETLWIGYIQSFGAFIPIAVSIGLRPVCFGLLAGAICKSRLSYGEKVAALLKNDDFIGLHGAIGIAIALVVAESIVFLILGIYYFLNDRHYDRKKLDKNLHLTESVSNTMRDYALLNCNGIYFRLMIWLFLLIPMIFVTDWQMKGIIFGKYLFICAIPVCIICARIINYQGRLVSVIRNHDNRMTRDYIQTGMQYTWSVSLLTAVLLAVLAPQITHAYFPQDEFLVTCLQLGSVLVVLASMIIYFCMVHSAHNRKWECIIVLMVTFIMYFLLERKMCDNSDNPKGVIYAAIISLLTGMLLMGAITLFTYGVRPDYITVFVLPLVCVTVTCLIVLLVSKYMTPHIGNHIACIIGFILGIVLYLGSLSLCRVFDDTDVDRLYGNLGKKLLSFIFK